ncbi:hypothetical protein E2C01_020393 [Portunus trituberculatus]|uniref:Uncharacterized protein n=1 Tax=Portunus trituberculatus TaxID=210409 RepID=A0A5B7E259_PORTR|nr:hypothetical protein [Portunus trituberculatus]
MYDYFTYRALSMSLTVGIMGLDVESENNQVQCGNSIIVSRKHSRYCLSAIRDRYGLFNCSFACSAPTSSSLGEKGNAAEASEVVETPTCKKVVYSFILLNVYGNTFLISYTVTLLYESCCYGNYPLSVVGLQAWSLIEPFSMACLSLEGLFGVRRRHILSNVGVPPRAKLVTLYEDEEKESANA